MADHDSNDSIIFYNLLDGLIGGHAYSVTKVVSIETGDGGQHHLIRIRNPWGDETEWTGPWSDGSKEWLMIPEVSIHL
jgi:calpain